MRRTASTGSGRHGASHGRSPASRYAAAAPRSRRQCQRAGRSPLRSLQFSRGTERVRPLRAVLIPISAAPGGRCTDVVAAVHPDDLHACGSGPVVHLLHDRRLIATGRPACAPKVDEDHLPYGVLRLERDAESSTSSTHPASSTARSASAARARALRPGNVTPGPEPRRASAPTAALNRAVGPPTSTRSGGSGGAGDCC